MHIVSIGGGPGGLYFGILMKQAWPDCTVTVYERNKPDDTFGFGVVFSDETLDNIAAADRETYREITESFAHWDDIDVHVKGQVLRSTGHGFSGMSRLTLLQILARRAAALGVDIVYEHEVDPADLPAADLLVVADGVNSAVRERYAAQFGPTIDWRPNKFTWLGTKRRFPAFSFYFKETEHGLWRAHAYEYDAEMSTFIVETTGEAWEQAGLAEADDAATVAFCEALFAEELDGEALIANRSIWRNFPTIRCARWNHDNMVLMGDAAHTAHFSIGSGTKLAMEDAIALKDALLSNDGVPAALTAYDAERRPFVESTQRAAQTSLEWFENTERYHARDPLEFTFGLLTRSLRINHENLALRDPAFVRRFDTWFATKVANETGINVALDNTNGEGPPPPMFTPYKLRDMTLDNRVVVSPMCMYSAEDGTVNDWHLVHLGSRAVGGAGLVIAEMTDVSRHGRISPGCAGIYKEEHVGAWRRIVDFVHGYSRAKIALQLGHSGRKGSTKLLWEGADEPLDEGNWPVLGPSPLPYTPANQVPVPMDRAKMDDVLEDYVRAVELAEAAGFDMIELHLAHGYLLATFVSPLTNRRDDEYGGSLANRMRYPLEVFDAVRAAWPEHKPMSVRMSATDWKAGGIDGPDAVEIAAMLKARGCDIVDVSAGQTVPDQEPRYGRLYQTPFSDLIRHDVGMPTMTVGAISSYGDVNAIIGAGRADLCVLARAHLFDPYWTRHAAYEQGYTLPWPDQYESLEGYTFRFK